MALLMKAAVGALLAGVAVNAKLDKYDTPDHVSSKLQVQVRIFPASSKSIIVIEGKGFILVPVSLQNTFI